MTGHLRWKCCWNGDEGDEGGGGVVGDGWSDYACDRGQRKKESKVGPMKSFVAVDGDDGWGDGRQQFRDRSKSRWDSPFVHWTEETGRRV